MSYIACVPTLYPDELLYSWLMRTIDMNALPFHRFANAYMGMTYRKYQQFYSFDIKKEFNALFQHQTLFTSEKDLIMQATTFPFEAMFFTEGEQTKYINYLTRPTDKLNATGRSLFLKIHLCPECMKEDRERYGEAYFHRVHQFSGLCVCPRHHVRLLEHRGKSRASDFLMLDYAPTQPSEGVDEDSLIAYADYVHALSVASVETNVEIIRQVIFQHLRENGHFPKDDYQALHKEFDAWEHKGLLLKLKRTISASFATQPAKNALRRPPSLRVSRCLQIG